ncbi:hypothetical protein [Streptomyces sp. VNUA24]|uniref:hypothetical protein n=1 Tax=Streptomyces sp. VNUA24 TaxID=3031131 RepID=UPI0023B80138|nr:hypothetical protein [Streptomyces sp. VNUA24]WEH12367.1 hypothetical protein PYR72_01115 [Streptomyces sp. VNUA24]
MTVPGTHAEVVEIDGQEHAIKLSVWIMNQKGRRARLAPARLKQLADLGLFD